MYGCLFMVLFLNYVKGEISGHVIGGTYTKILMYPHSILLEVRGRVPAMCGGSILNQNVVLTAAHCFDEHDGKGSLMIKYGSEILSKSTVVYAKSHKIHEDYSTRTLASDIALMVTNGQIRLGNSVKRVAIMRVPPIEKFAYVSGWGVENGIPELAKQLKHTEQEVQCSHVCSKLGNMPEGTFCAGPVTGPGHPSVGDSGGALIVNRFIQIGIVSYKEYKFSLVVYTNVSYHYSWIRRNSVNLYCNS